MHGIDHIGIAVRSIDKAMPFYTKKLKLTHTKTEVVESEGVRVAFLAAANCKIELLEPIHQDSSIYKFIEKKGEGMHHIAFQTDRIHEDIQTLLREDVQMIDRTPRRGSSGSLVAFLHPKQKESKGVLFELYENSTEISDL